MILIIRHRIAISFRAVIKRRTSHTSALRNPRVGAEEGDTCVPCPLYLYLEGTHLCRMIRGRGEREAALSVRKARRVSSMTLTLIFSLFLSFSLPRVFPPVPILSAYRHLYFRKTVHPRTQIALRNDLSSRSLQGRRQRWTHLAKHRQVRSRWWRTLGSAAVLQESGCALGFVSGWRNTRSHVESVEHLEPKWLGL